MLIAGCAQQQKLPENIPTQSANLPAVAVMYDSKIQQMSRNEVIMATHECETQGLRPVPIITKRLISGMMSEMIVDVVCMPKFK